MTNKNPVDHTEDSVSEAGTSQNEKTNFYGRVESRILQKLPNYITPLRFRILLGYLIVLLLAIYGWEHLASAWRYLITLLAPAFALLGALMALKLGVVFVSLFTLLIAVLKFFFGFLMVVLKPGILKAIFIPQLLSLAAWVHKKSARLQNAFRTFYNYLKALATRLMDWWKAQKAIDKILMSGFLIPLLTILVLVFIIERAVAIFAVKKLSEQVVQKSTKFAIQHFHKIPFVGGIPAKIANATRRLTTKEDRDDVVEDFKHLGQEIYHPDDNNESDLSDRQPKNTQGDSVL